MTFLNKFIVWNLMLLWLGLLYYGPQWWPLSVPHELAAGSIDRAVPFIPDTAWVYQSLFLLLPLATLIQPTKILFIRFSMGFCALVACFSAIFWLFPTQLRAPSLTPQTSWAYDHLVAGVDGRRNAFPSLHAALTVYAGTSITALYRQSPLVRGLTAVWMLLVLISTLTTKQHIAIDLLAGIFGGILAHRFAVHSHITARLAPA